VVAELSAPTEPALAAAEPVADKLAALAGSGFLTMGRAKLPDWCLSPIPGPAAPLLEAVLSERREGR
jgi:hypothetical protein